jgi:NADPH-dependent 2,4-dienoyl-CoA reductase/sulfur reductase-like enzyme
MFDLAELAGLNLGPSGGIAVNEANQTNDPDVYAVGDAVEKSDAVSHATSLIALANVANRQGRRVADHIAGRPSHPSPRWGPRSSRCSMWSRPPSGGTSGDYVTAGRPFPSHPLAPVRPRHLLSRCDAHGDEIDLRPDRRDRSSALRSSVGTESTSGST